MAENMQAVSSRAASLEFCSDQSLALISELLDAYDISRLYFCGSTSLNSRLTRSVRRFDLLYSSRSAKLWPRLIGVFSGLQTLKIDSLSMGAHRKFVHKVDYSIVPRSIKEMSLNFANGLLSLVTLPPASSANAKFQPQLRFSLLERFPELRSLEWDSTYISGMKKWDFTGFLREIDGPFHCPLGTLNSGNLPPLKAKTLFPTHLQGLSLTTTDWTHISVPPHLTFLSCATAGWEPLVDSFPVTLTCLRLKSVSTTEEYLNPKENQWTSLRKLVNLRILEYNLRYLPPLLVSCIPDSVTKLSLGVSYFEADVLANLPPRLETFCLLYPIHVEFLYENQIESKKIDSLNYSSDYKADNLAWKPYNSFPRSFTCCSQLPDTLTAASATVLPLDFPHLWSKMPRNLRLLLSVGPYSTEPESIPLRFYSKDFEFIASAPIGLRDWHIDPSSSDEPVLEPAILNRPRSLKIERCSHLDMVCQYHSLTSLTVYFKECLSMQSMNELKSTLITAKFYCSAFPTKFDAVLNLATPWAQCLEELVIPRHWIPLGGQTDDWFETLPPTLTSLEVEGGDFGPFIRASALLNLPPKLIYLNIGVDEVRAVHLAALPRTLELLTVKGTASAKLTCKDLKLLPYRLKRVSLPDVPQLNSIETSWIEENTKLDFLRIGEQRWAIPDFHQPSGAFSSEKLSHIISMILEELPEEPSSDETLPRPRRVKRPRGPT